MCQDRRPKATEPEWPKLADPSQGDDGLKPDVASGSLSSLTRGSRAIGTAARPAHGRPVHARRQRSISTRRSGDNSLGRAAGDRVQDPDQVPLRDRVGLGSSSAAATVPITGLPRAISADWARNRSLNEGWSSCLNWASTGSESLPRGRVSTAVLPFAVGHRVDPAELLGLVAPASHRPVGDIEGLAVVGQSQVERAEARRPRRARRSRSLGDLEVAPAGSNRKARTLPLAPLGPEQAAAIFLGPGVFAVEHAAAR